MYPYKIHT